MSTSLFIPHNLRCLRPVRTTTRLQWRKMSRIHGETHSHGPVELSYTSYVPEDGNVTNGPLVILHGLFGSRRNWGSMCKALHRDMPNRPIYALDLRNHGTSPHATPMTYEAMAGDVHRFIEEKKLKGVALLGHSMGGKAAMAYALSLNKWNVLPGTLSKLIIADIAPSIGSLSPEFIRYIGAMQKIEALPAGVIRTRTDADHKLEPYESDVSIRQFLLTNIRLPNASRAPHHDGESEKAKFIVPLSILSKSMEALGSFPYEVNATDNNVSTTWDGSTLAIKGTKSPYINHKNIPALRAFFPNVQLAELDANHWVHAEKPHEFKKMVVDFLSET